MALAQALVVDAIDHGDVLTAGRGRDQHPLGAGLQVLARRLALGEDAGAFQRHIDLELAPGQVGGIALGQHRHRAAAEIDSGLGGPHPAGERPVDRIVFQQMRVGVDGAQIVDGDDLEILAVLLMDGPQDEAPDAPKAVDRDPCRHVVLPLLTVLARRASAAEALLSLGGHRLGGDAEIGE